MNKIPIIALPSVLIAAASLILLAHASVASAAAFNEQVVKRGHGFELAKGESLTLANLRKPEPYRVCIEEVPGIVPLEVTVDNTKIEVLDGTCTDVVGAHISVRPSPKLPRDEVMVGRIERVKA
jgi:hypothetical protein